MRAVLLFFMVINFAFCFEVPVDCTQIFEARKEEISKELEVIDEQRQALEVFRASSAAAYEENNKKLAKKEADLNATIKVIEQKRKEIDEVVAKNEKILDQTQPPYFTPLMQKRYQPSWPKWIQRLPLK